MAHLVGQLMQRARAIERPVVLDDIEDEFIADHPARRRLDDTWTEILLRNDEIAFLGAYIPATGEFLQRRSRLEGGRKEILRNETQIVRDLGLRDQPFVE